MSSDNLLNNTFEGFVKAETPLELEQNTDTLITIEERPIEEYIRVLDEETEKLQKSYNDKRVSKRGPRTSPRIENTIKEKLISIKNTIFKRKTQKKPSYQPIPVIISDTTRKLSSKASERNVDHPSSDEKSSLSFSNGQNLFSDSQTDSNIASESTINVHSSYEKPLSVSPNGQDSDSETDLSIESLKGSTGCSQSSSDSRKIPSDLLLPVFRTPKIKSYRKRNKVLGKCFNCFCPMLTKLLYSKRTEYRGIKAMLGFPIGALFGIALHKLVLERLQLSTFENDTLACLLALSLGIGYALSTQVRCICFLTIPVISGKAGRTYLHTFVITFIITGPINNILLNGRESMRVMSCTAALSFNHTVERFKLMFKPVKEIVFDFVGAGDKITKGTKSIEGAYKAIDKEVRDEEETKMEIAETKELDDEIGQPSRVEVVKKKFGRFGNMFGSKSEAQYGMKSELRCESIFTKGVKGCYDSFGAAFDRCMGYLPIIGYLLCWPVKLTFICDIAGSYMGKRSCDSSDALSPGFGESMDTAENVQKEFDKEFGVTMQYKIDIPPEKIHRITPQDISASIRHKFEKRKQTLDFVLNMINRLMPLLFLQVFNASRKYCDKYLRNIEFDNRYITSYFRHIDARRRKKGKPILFPLKKGEKSELIEPFHIRFTTDEKATLAFNLMQLVGEATIVSILLSFDWIFYEFLMLIQRHASVTYYQTGAHHIKMTIYGDGFVGNMVRSVLKGFDKKHTIAEVTTTEGCLPQPIQLSKKTTMSIYGLFLLLFLLMLVQAYALRIRRVICGFFYPKREKNRVLFLYNDRMKKRLSYIAHMRKRIRKAARKQAISLDTGVFLALRHQYPKLLGWIGKLGFGKRKCLLCDEVESKTNNFVFCSEECPFCYCNECWRDMKEKCYVCETDDEDYTETDESLDEDEYD